MDEKYLNDYYLPKPAKKKKLKIFVFILAILITFIFGAIFGLAYSQDLTDFININNRGLVFNKNQKHNYANVDFAELFQLWEVIEKKYVNKNDLTEAQLFYGALAGSVASLNDPYSIFLNPELAEEFAMELTGSFEGIGAEIGIKNDMLTVISALPNTPADKAGLISQDVILAIDNQDTASLSLDQAINLIRGKSGTTVTLTIKRPNEEKLIELKITRSKIEIESVKWKMISNNIAYLEIISFNEDTSAEFKKAINQVLINNPKGIILDLRNNPGGYLDTAINIASYWIEDGVVVKEKYNEAEKDNEYQAQGNAKLKNFKTAVLINGGSASASEIVAGALQDYKLAYLIGETTFGKGTIQDLTTFDDGSALKLTIAYWLTPNDNMIEGEGIKPDQEVELTKDDYSNDLDPQLDEAIKYINQ